MNSSSSRLLPDRLPVLALHNIVIFPLLAISITARRPEDIKLLLNCQQKNELIAIANQHRPGALPLTYDNIYPVGTACRISQAKLNSASQLEAILEGVCSIQHASLQFAISLSFHKSESPHLHVLQTKKPVENCLLDHLVS